MHMHSSGSPSTLGVIVILVVLVWIIRTIVNGRSSSVHGGATVLKVIGLLAITGFVFVTIYSVRSQERLQTQGWNAFPLLANQQQPATENGPAPHSGFPAVNPEDMWALHPGKARAQAEAARAAERAAKKAEAIATHDRSQARGAEKIREQAKAEPTVEATLAAEAPEGTTPPDSAAAAKAAEAPVEPVTTEPTAAAEKPADAPLELAAATPLAQPVADTPATPLTMEQPLSNKPEPGHRVGDTYFTEVLVGDYATLPECEAELPAALRTAVNLYVDQFLGNGASRLFEVPPAYIHEHIVRQMHTETVSASFGPMKRLRVELAFDSRVRGQFLRWWHDANVKHRLHNAAIGFGGVLALLATVLGYLKLDTLSRGYYTGRLQIAGAAVILMVTLSVAKMLF